MLRRDPLALFTELRCRGEEISSFRFGRHRFLLVHDPELALQALLADGNRYQRETAAFKRWTRNPRFLAPSGLFMPQAPPERHLRARKALSPVFRRARTDLRYERLRTLAERGVTELEPGRVEIVAPLRLLTLEMALAVMFGRELEFPPAELVPKIETLIEVGTPSSSSLREVLRLLRPPRLLRLARAQESLLALLTVAIEQVRAEGVDGDDILSLLVRVGKAEGLGERELTMEAFGHLFSLPDSTVYVLAWMLALLAGDADAQARLAAEADALAGFDGEAGPSHSEAPFTHAVLAETMRLYPSAWRLGRWALVDHELGGTQVRRGDHVWVSPYTLHRDPRFWPDPDAFRPARWLDGSSDSSARRAYIPFSAGTRRCLGEYVARRESVAATLALARRFGFTLPAPLPKPEPAGALRPHGRRLELELTLRTPAARALPQPAAAAGR